MSSRCPRAMWIIIGLVVCAWPLVSVAEGPAAFVTRADSSPRKVVVASALANFTGSVEQRLTFASTLIDQAAADATRAYHGKGLDLIVLPEFAICRETGRSAVERAVTLN